MEMQTERASIMEKTSSKKNKLWRASRTSTVEKFLKICTWRNEQSKNVVHGFDFKAREVTVCGFFFSVFQSTTLSGPP